MVQGILCHLALSGSFDTLTDYVIFGSWIFYALVTSTIFHFSATVSGARPAVPGVGISCRSGRFLLVAGWLLINTMMTTPTQSFTGLFLIILGLPVYYYLNNKNRPESARARAGEQRIRSTEERDGPPCDDT